MNSHLIYTSELSAETYNTLWETLTSIKYNKIAFLKGGIVECCKTEMPESLNMGSYFNGYPFSFFENLCTLYRVRNNIPPEDSVGLITSLTNSVHWFGGLDFNKNFFVDVAKLHQYTPQIAVVYPTMYQIAASLIRITMGWDSALFQKQAHKETKGCVNDFCPKKAEFIHKIQSGKICRNCLSELKKRKINDLVIADILAIMDFVRANISDRHQADAFFENSRLVITETGKIYLSDYDKQFPFDTIEKAFYIFLLKHPKGKRSDSLSNEFRAEIIHIYQSFANFSEITYDKTFKPENITSILCKIRRKVVKTIGNLPESIIAQYTITTDDKKRILLDRNLVTIHPKFEQFTPTHTPALPED